MPTPPARSKRRPPLTRSRILSTALQVVDEGGLDALTMRSLGSTLGVEAMSLYKHVTNRDDILDGLVELVVAEIALPEGDDWMSAMRLRAHSARDTLARHPWALGLLESRTASGPAALRYYDAIIGSLRNAGFSIELAAHAFWTLDSFIYGHALQESSLPFDPALPTSESAAALVESVDLDAYPYLAELTTDHIMRPGYRYTTEFDYGIDLILDGLARCLDAQPPAQPQSRMP